MAFTVAFWSVSSSLLRGTAAAGGIALVNSLGNVGRLVGRYTIGRLKDATGATSDAFVLLAVLALERQRCSLRIANGQYSARPARVGLRAASTHDNQLRDRTAAQ
jgi:ACS family tartrate transporter-like MFS transporter